ncbi:hypothetical protein [Moorena bouillonii]|uniref:hypothetical protein n=1 Tax=Moorena bouillonii TaxID=207920 RepID=UPI0018E98F94|nr:hypothetical protein [Moorena bouillonii]
MPASPAPTIAKRILPYPFSFFTDCNIFREWGVGSGESGIDVDVDVGWAVLTLAMISFSISPPALPTSGINCVMI